MRNFVLILGLGLVLLTGCTKGEEVNCMIDGKEATIVLKNGIISSYTLDGTKKNSSEIAEINGEYFTSSTNYEEGKEALKVYMQSINGSCE